MTSLNDIPEAKTYYPSPKEFEDPMGYLSGTIVPDDEAQTFIWFIFI